MPVNYRCMYSVYMILVKITAYSFRVKVLQGTTDTNLDIKVCFKGYVSLHAITARRVQTFKKQLLTSGVVLLIIEENTPEDHKQAVHDFIASLHGRKAHYSLTKTTIIT